VRPVINSVARMSALPLTMLSSRLEHLVKTSLRALLMVMLSCCSGLAQPPTLTIDQAVQQALDRYPAVRSSLERVYAAAERLVGDAIRQYSCSHTLEALSDIMLRKRPPADLSD